MTRKHITNFQSFAQVNKLVNFQNNLNMNSPAENLLIQNPADFYLDGFYLIRIVVVGVEQSVKVECKNAGS